MAMTWADFIKMMPDIAMALAVMAGVKEAE